MERAIIFMLLFILLAWRNTGSGDAAVSPSWRPVLPTQLATSITHKIVSMPNRYSLREENSPVHHQSQLLGQNMHRDECALYKILMTQQLYFEYIHYKVDLPDLKEFTICMWKKFTNHTNDHPLFSYAGDQPRSILSWIANTQRSSFYMLNVDGHNLYRLNYPLRLNQWYHSCQSWNGHTGEWQIWVNDERVGRGFNNRLVGHIIKGGGVAISGQEQRELGGGFVEGGGVSQGGMLGELTMVQLYGVALTAGKAHRDHKHHHAHHFEHNINSISPSTTTNIPNTAVSLPMSPYLTGGQLNHQVKINPGAHIQIVRNGVTLRHPNLPVPLVNQQPLPPAIFPTQPKKDSIISSLQASLPYDFAKTLADIGSISASRDVNTRFLSMQADHSLPVNDYSFVGRGYRDIITGNIEILNEKNNQRKKQEGNESEEVQSMVGHIELKKIAKRESLNMITKQSEVGNKKSFEKLKYGSSLKKSIDNTSLTLSLDKKKQKRGLILADDTIIDDSYIHQIPQHLLTDNSGNSFHGLTSFSAIPATFQRQNNKGEEREPAEEEVRRVMNICDGCVDEPFEKAIIISWRTVPKKLYSGALHMPAVQVCKAF